MKPTPTVTPVRVSHLRHLLIEIPRVGDFGYYVFGKNRAAYVFSAFMLLANNILLIGFHILTGAKVLNTLSDHSLCTAVFSVIATIMGIVMSVPRTLNHVSSMSMVSCELSSQMALNWRVLFTLLTQFQPHAWESLSFFFSSLLELRMHLFTDLTEITQQTDSSRHTHSQNQALPGSHA